MRILPASAADATGAATDGGSTDTRRAAAVLAAIGGPARRRGVDLRDLALWRLAAGELEPDQSGPAALQARPGAGSDVVRGRALAGSDHGTESGGTAKDVGTGGDGTANDDGTAESDGTARDDGTGGDGSDDDPAGLVGAALERATDPAHRRAHGLHVTPAWLARDLVARALPPAAFPARSGTGAAPVSGAPGPAVCDPACGGGAFLVAAARLLHEQGHERRHVVRHLVWGADIDPVGLAAAEAALALWAGEPPPPGRLVVADALRTGAEAWPARPVGRFSAVVGNPPFQNQLGRDTARTADDRRALRARYGDAVRAYTDTAWLFLLLGLDLVAPDGRVVLVEPQSLIGARDAEAVRRMVAARGDLHDLWLDDDQVFSAAVQVCAPVVQRRAPQRAGDVRDDGSLPGSGAGAWRRAWARAVALPADGLAADHGTVGDRAAVVAGFRDQYYGLSGAVRERDELGVGVTPAPLVTSGAIDWARCAWGERPIRYAKRRWRAPVVDPGLLAGAPRIARRWVERTRAPKLVVASQTLVVEAAVDDGGTWVPSVPALAVVPHDPDDAWLLAAAVLAPAATLWIAHRSRGTALERRALKLSGPDLARLPLPSDRGAWRDAAGALQAHVARPTEASLERYLAAAERAYAVAPAVTAWWRTRLAASPRGRPAG